MAGTLQGTIRARKHTHLEILQRSAVQCHALRPCRLAAGPWRACTTACQPRADAKGLCQLLHAAGGQHLHVWGRA